MNIAARFRPLAPAPETPEQPEQPEQRVTHHPVVANFLERTRQLECAVEVQANEIAKLNMDLIGERSRRDFAERECDRLGEERNRFARGYFALEANLSAVTMTVMSAMRQVGDVALKAIEDSKAEMLRAGLSPEPPLQVKQELDDGVAEIAATFGANNRKAEADAA